MYFNDVVSDGAMCVREFYIEDTADLGEICTNHDVSCLRTGAKALNITNQDIWIFRPDRKWHKFGTSETYTPPIEITWDGDIEGKTVITVMDNVYMCKVSDKVFDLESVSGTSIETTSLADGNVSTTDVVAEVNAFMLNDGCVVICNSEGSIVAVSSNAGTVDYDDEPIEIPESGTYFVLLDDENIGVYASRLTKEAVIA
jgi:hypothetical protein